MISFSTVHLRTQYSIGDKIYPPSMFAVCTTKMAERQRVALIAGVTGIAGLNLAKKMQSTDKYGKWTIHGLSRRESAFLPPEVNHIRCDLLDAAMCKERLAPLGDVTHVFYTTGTNALKEAENVAFNKAMLSNLLDNLPTKPAHVILVTGLKHYMGSNEALATGQVSVSPVPYKESFGRLPSENFYYTLEDILLQKARQQGFSWSVARPSTIIGCAPFNTVNFGTSIAVYAAICKYSGKPLVYPGTDAGYDALLDVTDVELLAEHLLWEVTDPVAKNQAFNIVNGDVFKFRDMWKIIADYFELDVPDETGGFLDFQQLEPVWDEMVAKLGLLPLKFGEISTMWALGLLSLPMNCYADMTKSREYGFLESQNTKESFVKLFDFPREQKFIPGNDDA